MIFHITADSLHITMHTADTAIAALESLASGLLASLETLRATAPASVIDTRANLENWKLHRASDIADGTVAALNLIIGNIPLI